MGQSPLKSYYIMQIVYKVLITTVQPKSAIFSVLTSCLKICTSKAKLKGLHPVQMRGGNGPDTCDTFDKIGCT